MFDIQSVQKPGKFISALCIFYIFGGIVSILPFFFFEPFAAILPAVVVSIVALFSVGFIKGKIAKIDPIKSGLEMSLVSLSAAALGYLVGKLASVYLMKP